MKPIEITKTIRQYRLGQFKDQKGIACSIQESSLAGSGFFIARLCGVST